MTDKLKKEQIKLLINQLPKEGNLKEELTKAAEEIEKCYKYETYEKIQEINTGKSNIVGDYPRLKFKAYFNYYVRLIGAIDAHLDVIRGHIELEESFKMKSDKKDKQQKLFRLREQLVAEFHSATNDEERHSPLGNALNNYPTHSKIGDLYKIERCGYQISVHLINFDLAYKSGYISGKNISLEEIEYEYENTKNKIRFAIYDSDKEYKKAVTRARRI